MPELIVFRALQGFGAGGLFPLSLAVVGSIIPPRDRGRYQGLIGGVFAAASIAGPAVGGFLEDKAPWRWVFYVNLPVGGLALLVVYLTMPKRAAPRREHSIDWAGAAALAAGTTGLLLGLVWGGREYAWSSGHVVGALAAAGAALAAFAWVERRAREPILPFDLLRNQTVWASILCVALVGMAMFGTIAFVPLFVQGVIGTSATSSGVVLTPFMLGAVTTLTQFSRSIGATLGVTLMGVIVNRGLPRAARGHEQLSHRLPPRLRADLANALHPAFLAAAVVCGLVLVASILWIREVPLRRGFEDVAVGDEASPQPGTRVAAR